MVEGVVADLVVSLELRLHQVGVALRVAADEEERGVGVVGVQEVEDLRRPAGVGAVVEGQRHHPPAGLHTEHSVRPPDPRVAPCPLD